MLIDELKTGDLIFELDSMHTAEHVSMYAGKRKGLHYQVHATLGSYNSVMVTYLPAGNYEVIRSKDNNLALLATGIMYRWVEYQVLFANESKQNKLHKILEDGRGIDHPNASDFQEKFGKTEYGIGSIELYINMFKALPYVPKIAGERIGLFCSEAIIAAFNIALMMSHEELFKRLNETPANFPVSAILKTMITKLDNPLPFDASSTYPGGMYKHCIEDTTHWDNLGTLSHQEDLQHALSEQKADWLEFRGFLLEDAPTHVEQYMNMERTVTPRDEPLDLENHRDSPISAERSQPLLFWAGLPKTPRSSPVHFHGQDDPVIGQTCTGSPNRSSPQNLLLWGLFSQEIPRSSPILFLGQTDTGSQLELGLCARVNSSESQADIGM